MSIWFEPDLTAAQLQPLGKNTMGDHLGIEFTEVGEDFLKGRMPVDNLGSVAAAFVVDRLAYNAVGLEINANHLRGVREGFVTGIARPIHLGKTTHVWEIRISDDRDKLVCISRLTVAILAISPQPQEHR